MVVKTGLFEIGNNDTICLKKKKLNYLTLVLKIDVSIWENAKCTAHTHTELFGFTLWWQPSENWI